MLTIESKDAARQADRSRSACPSWNGTVRARLSAGFSTSGQGSWSTKHHSPIFARRQIAHSSAMSYMIRWTKKSRRMGARWELSWRIWRMISARYVSLRLR